MKLLGTNFSNSLSNTFFLLSSDIQVLILTPFLYYSFNHKQNN